LASLGGGVVIVYAFSSWLGRLWADRLMAKETAKHTQELERLRSDLRKVAFESEVRFSKLHEKRAEIIAELYSKLVVYVRSGENYLYGGHHDKKYEAYIESFKDLTVFLERSEIYFSDSLCKGLSDFVFKVKQHTDEKFVMQGYTPQTPAEIEESKKMLKSRWKAITEELPLLKKQLTDEFRSLLGVQQ